MMNDADKTTNTISAEDQAHLDAAGLQPVGVKATMAAWPDSLSEAERESLARTASGDLQPNKPYAAIATWYEGLSEKEREELNATIKNQSIGRVNRSGQIAPREVRYLETTPDVVAGIDDRLAALRNRRTMIVLATAGATSTDSPVADQADADPKSTPAP